MDNKTTKTKNEASQPCNALLGAIDIDNSTMISISDKHELPLGQIRKAYLVKFVNPEKDYQVNYVIKQDGTKEYGNFTLKGEDLTENQILKLFLSEAL